MHTGTILIIITLVITALNLIFLAKSAGGNIFATITARRLTYLIAVMISFAFILLLQSFISNDFSLAYVYQHSSLDLPLLYKISAVWAGQEGGFLVWLLFVCIIGAIIAYGNDENKTILLSIITITQFFLLISLIIHNPFAKLLDAHAKTGQQLLPTIPDGLGLNPLLQDVWMALHPPVLFAGYAASVVPFAYAVAALLKNNYDVMISKGYRWVIITAALLGTGIFLGGYWAYAVLGWGGFWGWDPVENSSLIPWLMIIALFHGLIVQRRTGALVRTNCAIALFQFILVLYSTFLTRSGVLSEFSVHSFSGENVSFQILFYLAFFLFIALGLLILRFNAARGSTLEQTAINRESFLIFGIIVILIYAAMIFIGTSFPVITKIFAQNPSAVTEEFYAIWSVPAGTMIALFIALVTFKRGEKFEKKAFFSVASISILFGILFNIANTANPSAYVVSIASFFLLFSVSRDWYLRRSKPHRPARIVHLAIAITLLGIIASTYHSVSIQQHLPKNREISIATFSFTFLGFTDEEKPHLRFKISKGNYSVEKRAAYYFSERTRAIYKEPAIIRQLFYDIYIAPQWFVDGRDMISTITLKKGETGKLGDVEITYLGMKETNKKAMQSGMPEIFIDAKIVHNKTTYAVSPGFRITEHENLEYIEAYFSTPKRKVLLKNVNPETKEATFFVEPAPDAQIPPDEVIVEISFKRLVNLVWIGTALTSLGLFLAFMRVRKQ